MAHAKGFLIITGIVNFQLANQSKPFLDSSITDYHKYLEIETTFITDAFHRTGVVTYTTWGGGTLRKRLVEKLPSGISTKSNEIVLNSKLLL